VGHISRLLQSNLRFLHDDTKLLPLKIRRLKIPCTPVTPGRGGGDVLTCFLFLINPTSCPYESRADFSHLEIGVGGGGGTLKVTQIGRLFF
jgi:hypothetical protein